MIGLKGALEQQNMRYGKTSHILASKQAGRQAGWFGGGGLNGRGGGISGEQGMGCVCER